MNKIHRAIFIISVLTLGNIISCSQNNREQHTTYDTVTIVDEAIVEYINCGIDLSFFAQDYTPYNDYFNFGRFMSWTDGKVYHLDNNGIPQVPYAGAYFYNPTTVAQYALMKYGRYINGAGSLADFLFVVEKLLSLQDSTGGFPYPFELRLYYQDIVLPPGWISCLAQGQSLSVFARAFRVTGDAKYLAAGNASLRSLMRRIESGGVMADLSFIDPSYKGFITFEEYPTTPPNYTMNGFILTAIGLYDWANIQGPIHDEARALAADLYGQCIRSLLIMLPYFDIGGFSVYDLGYFVYHSRPNTQIFYHAFHIQLLHVLHSITLDNTFRYYEQLWQSYIVPNIVNPLTLDCDKNSPQLKGSLLSFKADMHEAGKYEYKFTVRDPKGRWILSKPYSTDATLDLDTSGYEVGRYFLKVDIRDPGTTSDRKTMRIIKYDILPSPATDVLVAIDGNNPVMIGADIGVIGNATGGSGEYEYRFWLKSGADWTVVQEYSPGNRWVFETSSRPAGIYYVQVDARSKGSVLYVEASKVIEVDLRAP